MRDTSSQGRVARAVAVLLAAAAALALSACEVEKRDVGPSPPLSPPTSAADGRAALYASNRYEMSEGARMFRWFGCDGCHTDPAPGYLHLGDRQWRRGGTVPEIYRVIAEGAPGMAPYEGRITPQQIWQVAGYVHGMNELKPEARRRNANALSGEPSGSTWAGPLG